MIQFNSLSQEDIFSPPLYLVSIIFLMISTLIKPGVCEKDIKSQKKEVILLTSYQANTSIPFSVTRIVFSHCADNFPSFV